MSEALRVIVDGTTYDLNDLTTYTHLRSAGFGMPPVRRLTQQGPMQHGVSDVGYRLQPRILQLVMFIDEDDEDAYWGRRNAILDIFKPSDTVLQLQTVHGAGVVRQLDCHYSGGLELGSDGRMGWAHRMGIELYCPEPSWYNPTADIVTYTGTLVGGLYFPALVPLLFSGGTYVDNTDITYVGTWRSYPTVLITGPCDRAIVENLTTDEKLDMTYTLLAGESITIDCSYGVKTAIKQPGDVNMIGYLSSDSDLATFHLEPAPVAPLGINDMQVTIVGAEATIGLVTISYYSRYIGV